MCYVYTRTSILLWYPLPPTSSPTPRTLCPCHGLSAKKELVQSPVGYASVNLYSVYFMNETCLFHKWKLTLYTLCNLLFFLKNLNTSHCDNFLILCTSLTGLGHGVPRYLVKHYFWVCPWGCFWMRLAFELVASVKQIALLSVGGPYPVPLWPG